MKRRIGLLGGSFNPAHDGHLYISKEALKRLKLDEVWWLVSPGNPLKSSNDMAPFTERFASAETITQHETCIKVSDIEITLGTRYTIDTLRRLKKQFPRTKFVWLMGADNLTQFHRWKAWDQIASLVPMAIFDRLPFSHECLRSKTALRFYTHRKPLTQAPKIPQISAPSWVYMQIARHSASATSIRNSLGKKSVLRHN